MKKLFLVLSIIFAGASFAQMSSGSQTCTLFASVSGKTGQASISNTDLAKATAVTISFVGCTTTTGYKVKSYDYKCVSSAGTVTKSNTGAMFSADILNEIKNLKGGETVTFENVQVLDSKMQTSTIRSLELTITTGATKTTTATKAD